ncbi:MAG TPA: hypothetical protein VK961_09530 [Chthoniobacter sp.]|nr:hypothetical protein [Chthoniobacter sp.]
MKRFFKIVGILVLVAVLGVAALIGLVEFFHWRNETHLDALVARLSPGTSFSAATDQLGQPTEIVVDPSYMAAFRRSRAQTDVPGPKLNLFPYHSWTGFYWVLVFTDADAKVIQHAEWNTM